MGNNKNEYTPGPYDETTTRTYEVSPIKITITETVKSSHVPPAGGCGCGGGLDIGSIMQAAQAAAQYAGQYAGEAPEPTAATPPTESK